MSGLSVSSIYDTYLRRTNLTTLNNSTPLGTNSLEYDSAGRLSTVRDGPNTGYSAIYTYLGSSSLISQIAFKDNTTTRMTTTKQYDKLDRLQSISSTPSGASAPSLPVGYQYLC